MSYNTPITSLQQSSKMTELGLSDYKAMLLVVMVVVTIFSASLPLALVKCLTNGPSTGFKRSISYLNCFSGGVFLGACLLDLMPDVRESMELVVVQIEESQGIEVSYPVAEFVMAVGFFLVLVIEQVTLFCKEREIRNARQLQGSERQRLAPHTVANHGTFEQWDDTEVDNSDMALLRSILLLIALSFHSVFEGLAIGLQLKISGLFSLFIAVIIHKTIMAFSLGLTIVQSPLSRRSFALSVLIFALASPVGMSAGMALAGLEKSLARDIVNAVLQGISGGTFLYITFIEVLPQELNSPHSSRLLRLVYLFLGFCSIGLGILISHE